jgi:DNA-binding transcriptional MerR regulator
MSTVALAAGWLWGRREADDLRRENAELRVKVDRLSIRVRETDERRRDADMRLEQIRPAVATPVEADPPPVPPDAPLDARLDELRRENALLQHEMGEMEKQAVGLARENARLQDLLDRLSQPGNPPAPLPPVSPLPSLAGKVQAVSEEFHVAIISLGADDGVKVGHVFTLHRGDQFIAKGSVDKVERDWSMLRWEPAQARLKVMVGDDVSAALARQMPEPR